MTTRVAIYARVSTGEQSPEAQLRELRLYAEHRGFHITPSTSRIDERIAELERLKAGLAECISCGCLSLERCGLVNPADKAALLGPGPRYWVGEDRTKSRR